ncbi:hypothetical protein HYFRA_00004784 [Hymenoscyphus fraxineus]|uniref:Uncharacterized protein n=1 Tax=Hymenoscyphus fraxineus TaxID=746836 RepID=A0A9N9PP78_9HELO|nr:hypothetical protein HYFRA_00004784 [Hymenoscyphus fraxineus]
MAPNCLSVYDPDNTWNFCPSLPAAILFTVLFGIVSALHVFQAARYKTTFCWAIIMGALWETASFLIRNISIYNPKSEGPADTWFLLFLLAPLWINAFDYMLLGRMVFQYLPNQKLGGIKAQRMALYFVILDIVSFIVQIGGGLMVISKNNRTRENGLHIYTAGLVLQECFILVFAALVFTFNRRVKREASVEQAARAKKLVLALYASLFLISIRIIYRLLEFAGSFDSALTQELWTHEVYQYALDATPMFFALLIMVVMHPGRVLPGEMSTFKQFSSNRVVVQGEEKSGRRFFGRKKVGSSGSSLEPIQMNAHPGQDNSWAKH